MLNLRLRFKCDSLLQRLESVGIRYLVFTIYSLGGAVAKKKKKKKVSATLSATTLTGGTMLLMVPSITNHVALITVIRSLTLIA